MLATMFCAAFSHEISDRLSHTCLRGVAYRLSTIIFCAHNRQRWRGQFFLVWVWKDRRSRLSNEIFPHRDLDSLPAPLKCFTKIHVLIPWLGYQHKMCQSLRLLYHLFELQRPRFSYERIRVHFAQTSTELVWRVTKRQKDRMDTIKRSSCLQMSSSRKKVVFNAPMMLAISSTEFGRHMATCLT